MKDLCYQITAVLFSSHQTAALVWSPQTIPFPALVPTLLPNFQTILPHFHFHFDRFTLKCGQSTCSCDDMTSQSVIIRKQLVYLFLRLWFTQKHLESLYNRTCECVTVQSDGGSEGSRFSCVERLWGNPTGESEESQSSLRRHGGWGALS